MDKAARGLALICAAVLVWSCEGDRELVPQDVPEIGGIPEVGEPADAGNVDAHANLDVAGPDLKLPETLGDDLDIGPDTCVPDCDGKYCGNDGCGGECGGCYYDGELDEPCVKTTCENHQCVFLPLTGTECDMGQDCYVNDYCEEGLCTLGEPNPDEPDCACCSSAGCPFDGNYCNGGLECNPDTCVCETDPELVVTCPDHENQCKEFVCQPNTGKCEEQSVENFTACDAGKPCKVDDICLAGKCVPGQPKDCDDHDSCTYDSCDSSSGDCVHEPKICGDDLAWCGEYWCDPATGWCEYEPWCDDGNPCTYDSCVLGGEPWECTFVSLCDGGPCYDADCDPLVGKCMMTKKDYDDGNPCTDDSCTDEAGIQHVPKDCDDGNACSTGDYCDVATGQCVNVPIYLPCTACEEQVIGESICSCQPLSCDDSNPCTIDSCDLVTGCKNEAAPEVECTSASQCGDQDPCTHDYCNLEEGCLCAHPPKDCDDGDECSVDWCAPLSGKCMHMPVKCEDFDPCTDDWCAPPEGCEYVPVDCGPGKACVDGKCEELPPTLTIVDPPEYTGLQLQVPVTPLVVSLTVENWADLPEPGYTVQCYLDGDFDGSSTEATYTFSDIPPGRHSLCCELALNGEALNHCEAADCLTVDVSQPCTGYGDPVCQDTNPCSVDACVAAGGGVWVCKYGDDIGNPNCCQDHLECPCSDGNWQFCDPDDNLC